MSEQRGQGGGISAQTAHAPSRPPAPGTALLTPAEPALPPGVYLPAQQPTANPAACPQQHLPAMERRNWVTLCYKTPQAESKAMLQAHVRSCQPYKLAGAAVVHMPKAPFLPSGDLPVVSASRASRVAFNSSLVGAANRLSTSPSGSRASARHTLPCCSILPGKMSSNRANASARVVGGLQDAILQLQQLGVTQNFHGCLAGGLHCML